MRPHRKASGTARGEGRRSPSPLDSPPAAKAEPWNHHAAMTSPQGSPRPNGPRKTDTGLAAGAGGPAMRRSARLQPPRHHGPSHGRTSRPLRGQSSRTRSRASSHPARGDAPPAGRPASGSYPRTAGSGPCPAMPCAAGPGNGAAHRCAAIPDFLCDRSAEAS